MCISGPGGLYCTVVVLVTYIESYIMGAQSVLPFSIDGSIIVVVIFQHLNGEQGWHQAL